MAFTDKARASAYAISWVHSSSTALSLWSRPAPELRHAHHLSQAKQTEMKSSSLWITVVKTAKPSKPHVATSNFFKNVLVGAPVRATFPAWVSCLAYLYYFYVNKWFDLNWICQTIAACVLVDSLWWRVSAVLSSCWRRNKLRIKSSKIFR